ncbi:MAG: hypothetical protein IRY94_15060 [Rhodospirillaceae bacterium]|nr:hypothetical protein [Rhodospirillaceae bacterium]
MIKVLILVCSMTVSHANCQTDTALFVIDGPDATNMMACGFQGQAYIAGSALGLALRPDQYVKVQCRPPTSIGKDNIG